jgi:hypothetical protein
MDSPAEIDLYFDQYCTATPFTERSLRSWQRFAGREAAPLTFHKHNNAFLRKLYTLAQQDLAEQKQRTQTHQVKRSYIAIALRLINYGVVLTLLTIVYHDAAKSRRCAVDVGSSVKSCRPQRGATESSSSSAARC